MAGTESSTGWIKEGKVSIVITSYNYAKYLGKAIESALWQTYPETEVLVVDGGSHDGSVSIAKKYPVRLLELEDASLCSSIAEGVRASEGEFFVILNSDDALHPRFVEKTVDLMRKSPGKAFVYPEMIFFGEDEVCLKTGQYSPKALAKCLYIHPSCLMRREAFEAAGACDASLGMLEDWDYFLTLAERGFCGVLLEEPLLFYRQHPEASRGLRSVGAYLGALSAIDRKHRAFFDKTLSAADKAGVFFARIPHCILIILRTVPGFTPLWKIARGIKRSLPFRFHNTFPVSEENREIIRKLAV